MKKKQDRCPDCNKYIKKVTTDKGTVFYYCNTCDAYHKSINKKKKGKIKRVWKKVK